MIIHLEKFGSLLTSREGGREAVAAFAPTMRAVAADETIEVEFEGVGSLSPSWADEFLTRLHDDFGDRLVLSSSENLSVRATIDMLETVHGYKYRWASK